MTMMADQGGASEDVAKQLWASLSTRHADVDGEGRRPRATSLLSEPASQGIASAKGPAA